MDSPRKPPMSINELLKKKKKAVYLNTELAMVPNYSPANASSDVPSSSSPPDDSGAPPPNNTNPLKDSGTHPQGGIGHSSPTVGMRPAAVKKAVDKEIKATRASGKRKAQLVKSINPYSNSSTDLINRKLFLNFSALRLKLKRTIRSLPKTQQHGTQSFLLQKGAKVLTPIHWNLPCKLQWMTHGTSDAWISFSTSSARSSRVRETLPTTRGTVRLKRTGET